MFKEFISCTLCPQSCRIDRNTTPLGKCRTDSGYNIAAISLHKGEEPLISGEKGICNIFFSGCNLQCIYCQNYQISRCSLQSISKHKSLEMILDSIESIIDNGAKTVGFVSPSHVLPQVVEIIESMSKRGIKAIKVYNTNAYELPENLSRLEGLIDIYLPDFKYSDADLGYSYSGVTNYPEFAAKSIKEMYRQKGSKLFMDRDEQAESGLVIRHLVLPGHIENSLNVLRYIAQEISTNVHISLMSQYFPTPKVKGHVQLGRRIREEEYNCVVEEMYRLGFQNGWTQEIDSSQFYIPDFEKNEPFT
jgi:putative pyruvate formate lyase activating enzyme